MNRFKKCKLSAKTTLGISYYVNSQVSSWFLETNHPLIRPHPVFNVAVSEKYFISPSKIIFFATLR